MRYFMPVLALASVLPVAALAWNDVNVSEFKLHVNEKFNQCLSKDGATPPFANVKVIRGDLNDTLQIFVSGLKPNLAFDLFTVQRSNLDADGSLDPEFASKFAGSFGLAWYQSDLQADENGVAKIISKPLRSIFLDQIFGFDADKRPDGTTILPPTNTFHVGFWFNDPKDAEPCGFTGSTPFNGEHKAGPLAMISLPDKTTGLGPLCTSPSNDPTTGNCNP